MQNKFLLLIAIFFCLSAKSLKAQNIISDLETPKAGEGTVRIVCDTKINELLGTPTTSPHASESVSTGGNATATSVGYRIQIYMDNSPKARNEAVRIENLFKEAFSNEATYIRYNAPNWKLLVGDFRTKEEAVAFQQSIRTSLPEYSKEMYIIPSRINLPAQK